VESDDAEVSSALVGEAVQTGRTVLRDEGLPEDLSESLLLSGVRSALCAPVLVHGKVDCLLYVTHQMVGHLFGEEERRIGDYLASLAGAALENALNFHERQKATERFETLFRWTGVGTAVVSREGQISEANPFFEQMLGLSKGGIMLDGIYQGDRTLVEEGWRTLFESGEPLRLEVRCLRASGELLWAQLTASRPPGENLAIAAFSDVSDRRLTQVAAFQESERRLLAAELHDGISQPLAALYIHLQTAALDAKGAKATQLKDCVQQAKSLVTEISQLMFDLRNPISGEIDAVQAVTELSQGFAVETGITVDVQSSGGQVHALAGTFLFRLVQEALTNIRKHARASRVEVNLQVTECEVVGYITDNGQGFDSSEVTHRATRHFGLKGMKERAELLGGSWNIDSRPGEGTRVHFHLPLS
jgi:PAS domain S-box-containing protein